MGRDGDQYRFAVTRMGARAEDVLSHDGGARVAAVFEHSFYLDAANGMACIVNPNLESGPLNAVCSAPLGMNWRASGLRVGERVVLYADTVRIGGSFVFTLDGARLWHPEPIPVNRGGTSLSEGLDKLHRLADRDVPEDGLGRLVFGSGAPDAGSLVLRHASEPVDRLCAWLRLAMTEYVPGGVAELNGVEKLLGLGPGLTPAGDDFLGGVMIALHALGQHQALRALSLHIGPVMEERTTPISAEHLTAAMNGMGSAPQHDLLHGILSGDDTSLADALLRVRRIGHTSGWDCLAGIVATLRSWIDAGVSLDVVLPNSAHRICCSAFS